MVLPITPSVVEMSGAPPSTVTSSLTVATVMLKSISTFWLTLRSRPSRATVLKPCIATVTLYGPGGRLRSV